MITYTFTVRDAGSPIAAGLLGLTPTFGSFRDVAAGTDLSASAPAITAVGEGVFKFTLDWTAVAFTGIDSISMVVDAGVTIVITSERFISGRLNRVDDFADDIDTILEVSIGTWEVTVGNQLILFEQDGVTEIARYDLTDISGAATNTAPAKRTKV